MNTLLIIVIVAISGWLLLMFGLKGVAALLRRGALKAARATLHGDEILRITDNASYLGANFPGPNLPPRTSGVLAITKTRLLFLPWFPRRAITLPRDTVAGVSLRGSFGEMAFNLPILILKVKGVGDPDGEMAWILHDPSEWEREISSILR